MLTAIENDCLHWDCLHYDEYGERTSCGRPRSAHVAEVVYHSRDAANARGPVLALPRCSCGVQFFLKADYSVKEALRCVLTITRDGGDAWAYAMRPQHARNLVAHWMLYERGQAAYAPVLPMPPRAVALACAQRHLDTDTLYALWFGAAAVRAHLVQRGTPQLLATASPLEQFVLQEKNL